MSTIRTHTLLLVLASGGLLCLGACDPRSARPENLPDEDADTSHEQDASGDADGDADGDGDSDGDGDGDGDGDADVPLPTGTPAVDEVRINETVRLQTMD